MVTFTVYCLQWQGCSCLLMLTENTHVWSCLQVKGFKFSQWKKPSLLELEVGSHRVRAIPYCLSKWKKKMFRWLISCTLTYDIVSGEIFGAKMMIRIFYYIMYIVRWIVRNIMAFLNIYLWQIPCYLSAGKKLGEVSIKSLTIVVTIEKYWHKIVFWISRQI